MKVVVLTLANGKQIAVPSPGQRPRLFDTRRLLLLHPILRAGAMEVDPSHHRDALFVTDEEERRDTQFLAHRLRATGYAHLLVLDDAVACI